MERVEAVPDVPRGAQGAAVGWEGEGGRCPRADGAPLLPPSDHPVRGGGDHHPAAHLPPQEDPHRHRAHQGGQQVRATAAPVVTRWRREGTRGVSPSSRGLPRVF